MATLDAPAASASAFDEWLRRETEDLVLEVALKRENDQWFALLTQFDITGVGESRTDAVRDSFALLFAYLRAYFEDGASVASALRPVPRSLRLRIEAESLFSQLARHVSMRIPSGTESRYELPPGTLSNFAHC